MSALTEENKKALLRLARSVITSKLIKTEKIERPDDLSPEMIEKRGCFVTLEKNGMLRGCIGSIEPVKPMIECIEANAVNAAFRDPRFPSVTQDELPEIDLEISILTQPVELRYSDADDLLDKLRPRVHGVIISKGFQSATFLPQVWQQLPDKVIFLEHLCQKAGMHKNAWKEGNLRVQVYEVSHFSEND